MAYWLLKTEPDCYCWDDLVRDKKTVWDGITNALALKHLRTARKGDQALIYHTGTQRAAVGTAKIISDPYPDPALDDDRLAVVDIALDRKFARPVTLEYFKSDPAFVGWDLLRLGRLSFVPVPGPMWNRIKELSRAGAG